MKNIKSYTTIFLLLFLGRDVISQIPDDVSYIKEEGIYIEQYSDTLSETRYTDDNVIYKPGIEYIYSYVYVKDEREKLFEVTENDWQFIDCDSITDATIVQISLTTFPDFGPFSDFKETYDQSVIQYSFQKENGNLAAKTFTGAIENVKNVWLHPPRYKFFKILELNPFPFIMTPYEIDNQWTWNLEVGDSWGDHRWIEWNGLAEVSYTYTIKETNKPLETPFGEIETIVIEAVAVSRLGKTSLTSYFNSVYGFVLLDYTNIDGSKTILKLEKVL